MCAATWNSGNWLYNTCLLLQTPASLAVSCTVWVGAAQLLLDAGSGLSAVFSHSEHQALPKRKIHHISLGCCYSQRGELPVWSEEAQPQLEALNDGDGRERQRQFCSLSFLTAGTMSAVRRDCCWVEGQLCPSLAVILSLVSLHRCLPTASSPLPFSAASFLLGGFSRELRLYLVLHGNKFSTALNYTCSFGQQPNN